MSGLDGIEKSCETGRKLKQHNKRKGTDRNEEEILRQEKTIKKQETNNKEL